MVLLLSCLPTHGQALPPVNITNSYYHITRCPIDPLPVTLIQARFRRLKLTHLCYHIPRVVPRRPIARHPFQEYRNASVRYYL
jgi:hypothetical protein